MIDVEEIVDSLRDEVDELEKENAALRADLERVTRERDEARQNLAEASRAWDGPETGDFVGGVRKEAAFQVAHWGVDHDAGKGPEHWFWLLGYLSGKALRSAIEGDAEKAKHHTISSAAALMNWHAALSGTAQQMRPGIDPEGFQDGE